MDIYFADFGDEDLRAYKSEREVEEDIVEDLSFTDDIDDADGQLERRNNIFRYIISSADVILRGRERELEAVNKAGIELV